MNADAFKSTEDKLHAIRLLIQKRLLRPQADPLEKVLMAVLESLKGGHLSQSAPEYWRSSSNTDPHSHETCKLDKILSIISHETIESSFAAARSDNYLAWLVYHGSFDYYGSEQQEITDLIGHPIDLPWSSVKSQIPLLKSGSNNYQELRSSIFGIDWGCVFSDYSMHPDAFLVIPEPQSIIEICQHKARSSNSSPINSYYSITTIAHWLMLKGFPSTCSILELFSNFRYLDLLRAFDSHLSIAAYVLIISHILSSLSYDLDSPINFNYDPRTYLPDLASRFSSVEVCANFPRSINPIESRSGSSKRGLSVSYRNDEPLIDRKLLIIGDSHSYSSIAPLASQIFSSVRFDWAPIDRWANLIAEFKSENPGSSVVVESTERFFLANFTHSID